MFSTPVDDVASGETFRPTRPPQVKRSESPQGDRDDAQLAIAAANRAQTAGRVLQPSSAPTRWCASRTAIESRRDDLARTLTLDQGKPIARRATSRELVL